MQDAVDGIVAAIDDKIILKSDIVLNMQLSGVELSQNQIQLEKIYNNFLEQMINDNILLVAAEKDTNVVVDNNMVDSRLSEYMNNIINEVGSEKTLETMFNKSIREIKYYYRKQIYEAMLREMYVYNYLGDLEVSRREVEVFYDTYKDSLPVVPAQYSFSMIEMPITPSEEEINKIKQTQLDLYNRINQGEDFSELAKEFSDDPGTANSGGDQGYYNTGTLFPEFEKVAFNLEKDEVSEPVQTPIGFHIIKLLDKRGDQIHTQHILTLINKTSDDQIRTFNVLEKIYDNTINDPGAFDSLAVVYGEQYNNSSGVYKDISQGTIPENINAILQNSQEYVLNKPIKKNNSSYIMIYPYQILKAGYPTIENNWEELELYAKNKKQTDLLSKLIKKLKHRTFIKYYN